MRSEECDQAGHHVHLDVTVHEEVAAQVVGLGAPVRLVTLLESGRHQQNGRSARLDDERFRGTY